MALDFPASPSLNQVYPSPPVPGVPVYVWDGEKWASGSPARAPFDAMAYSGLQINGGMEVSQQNGTTVVPVANGAIYVVDGFGVAMVGSGAVMQGQQTAIASVPGFSSALAFNCTGANSLAGSLDGSYVYQYIEGYRWSRLGFGTAWAQPVTIGFWIFPLNAGTMAVSIRSGDRSYAVDVPVTATTWQYKTATFPGCTDGTWPKDNTSGATVSFCFGAGSSRKITANTWSSTGNGVATASTTNFFSATSGSYYITGVIVLPGNEAPSAARSPFVMRPYDQELMTCRRYLWRRNLPNPSEHLGTLQMYSSTQGAGAVFTLSPEMRVAPTITISNSGHFAIYSPSGTGIAGSAVNFTSAVDAVYLNTSTFAASGHVGGGAANFYANAVGAWIQMSAQL